MVTLDNRGRLALTNTHGEATRDQNQTSEAGQQDCTGEGQSEAAYSRYQEESQGEKGSGQAHGEANPGPKDLRDTKCSTHHKPGSRDLAR